jgi:hypothetical protein
MSHDFLSSLHSPIFEEAKAEPKQNPRQARAGRRKNAPETEDDRHRTVGISMSPRLRERATARAAALGLPFSRYVQWCVEAELDNRPPQARFDRPPG